MIPRHGITDGAANRVSHARGDRTCGPRMAGLRRFGRPAPGCRSLPSRLSFRGSRDDSRRLTRLPHVRTGASAASDSELLILLRPARPRLRLGRSATHGDTRITRGRPTVAVALRVRAACPASARTSARAGPDAAASRAAVGRRAWHARAVAKARDRQPNPFLQGQSGGGSRREGEATRDDDPRLLVNRKPRGRGRRTRGRRGAGGRRVLPSFSGGRKAEDGTRVRTAPVYRRG